MQTIIYQLSNDQLHTVLSEVLKLEFSKFNNVTPPEEPEYITRKETAHILGVSLVTLNVWSKTGVIPAYRIESRVRYKKSEVLNSLTKVRTGGKGL